MPTFSIPQALQLALEHYQANRLREAEQIFRQVLAQDPNQIDALHGLGLIAHQSGHHEAAARLLARVAAVKRDDAELHAALGASLGISGRIDESIAALRRANELDPTRTDVQRNISNAYRAKAHIHYTRGVDLEKSTHREAALAEYEKAIELDPTFAEAHFNLAAILSMGMDVSSALRSFREAARLKPSLAVAHDMVLHFLHHQTGIAPRGIFDEHVAWAKKFADPLLVNAAPHENDRDPHRRLRVGYVSADFRKHSVAYFIEPLLAAHDPREVEVYCYADQFHTDATTKRLQDYGHVWRDITKQSDDDVARLIRNDRIDILIDLAGHSRFNRLLVFARKPAPVQVTYLGYPDTTGMQAMDYRLTDELADPAGEADSLSVEELVRLPACAWCYRPDDNSPGVEARSRGAITFGSFNVASKINPQLIALWAQILHAVPASRMMVKTGYSIPALTHSAIRDAFSKLGIGADRVDIVGLTTDVREHLREHSRVDIALDSFPYHGTTTTCESLWMGTPVISLAGQTHASRVGASLLQNVGLGDLVASSPQDYVRIAIDLANDRPRLENIRQNLRDRMLASPLLDGPRLARDVEHAFRCMWQKWCAKPHARG